MLPRKLAQFVPIYLITVTLFLLLREIVGENFAPIGFINNFLHLILMPAIFIFLFSLFSRKKQFAVLSLIPVIAFAVLWGEMFVSSKAKNVESQNSIKILTFNTLSNRTNSQNIVKIIKEVDADIVALQEVSTDSGKVFAKDLASHYPFFAVKTAGKKTQGQAFFSKFPITKKEDWMATNVNQRLELNIRGRKAVVYNIHPPHPGIKGLYDDAIRGREVDLILKKLEKDKQSLGGGGKNSPVLVMGDMNMTDQSDHYKKIAGILKDSYKEVGVGLGPTYPSLTKLPLIRIDYVFHNDFLKAEKAEVWDDSGGSDHKPLFVTLTLK